MSTADTTPAPAIDVWLAGRGYSMRPTFGALERIEAHLGVGVGLLHYRIGSNQHGVRELARIVYEGVRADLGNEAPRFEEIGPMVAQEGINRVTPAALEFLSAAVLGFEAFEEARREAGEGARDDDEGEERERPTAPQGKSRSTAASPGAASSPGRSGSESSPANSAA